MTDQEMTILASVIGGVAVGLAIVLILVVGFVMLVSKISRAFNKDQR